MKHATHTPQFVVQDNPGGGKDIRFTDAWDSRATVTVWESPVSGRHIGVDGCLIPEALLIQAMVAAQLLRPVADGATLPGATAATATGGTSD